MTYVTFLLTRQYTKNLACVTAAFFSGEAAVTQATKNPELCNVRCGDEFGLELNWNGALNHVL